MPLGEAVTVRFMLESAPIWGRPQFEEIHLVFESSFVKQTYLDLEVHTQYNTTFMNFNFELFFLVMISAKIASTEKVAQDQN